MPQTTDTLLMIAPTYFGFNEEAAKTNSFQQKIEGLSDDHVAGFAAMEFENYVDLLRAKGVNVIVHTDLDPTHSPDSIFPNNWISTHNNERIITYPMEPANRRLERRQDIIDDFLKNRGYKEHVAFEKWEADNKFLEGTGSIVFDHDNQLAYAALSSRTQSEPLEELCELLGYRPVSFKAYGPKDELIYHTNVVMCVGETFVAIGLDTLDPYDHERIKYEILSSGKELIRLTKDQTHLFFAGNMLQVRNPKGEMILLVSQKAYHAFTEEQLSALKRHNDHILSIPIPVIETYGGGSVRCMVAEVF